jgi:hypothetical protein
MTLIRLIFLAAALLASGAAQAQESRIALVIGTLFRSVRYWLVVASSSPRSTPSLPGHLV